MLLRNVLPAYMFPTLWSPVISWPLTTSGRTYRRCLVAVCEALSPAAVTMYQRGDSSVGDNAYRSLRAHAEQMLASTRKQVLRKDKEAVLEPNDDFFKLGGDLLGAIMLVALLKEKDISINAQEVFTTRTLRDMAHLIKRKCPVEVRPQWKTSVLGSRETDDEKQSSIASSSSECLHPTPATSDDEIEQANQGIRQRSPSLSSTDIDDSITTSSVESVQRVRADQISMEAILPASFIQLCFLLEGQKWCRAYYAWSFLRLPPSTTVVQIQEACTNITRRHPILRTSFHMVRRQCYQAVRKATCDFKILCHTGSSQSICSVLDQDVQEPVCFNRVLTRFRLLIDKNSGR